MCKKIISLALLSLIVGLSLPAQAQFNSKNAYLRGVDAKLTDSNNPLLDSNDNSKVADGILVCALLYQGRSWREISKMRSRQIVELFPDDPTNRNKLSEYYAITAVYGVRTYCPEFIDDIGRR